jgi:hypothetical protein
VLAHARELGVERAGVKLVESPVERMALGEAADVVIFEDYGSFGYTARLRSIFEAASKLAKPGVRHIPSQVELRLAPVSVANDLDPKGLPFDQEGLALFAKRLRNLPTWRPVKREQHVAPAAEAGVVDRTAKRSVAKGVVTAARGDVITGLLGWTVMRMPGGGEIDNLRENASWPPMFFPLEESLPCRAGERLELFVEVAAWAESQTWRWGIGGSEGTSVNALAGSVDLLKRGSAEWAPPAVPEREEVEIVLRLADGRRPAGEIGKALRAALPGRYPTEGAAVAKALEITRKLGIE